MHLKRRTINTFWPVAISGTKYIAVSSHNQNTAIPLLVMARDVLKIVKNKKELKALIHEKKININGKIINETNFPVNLFDSIGFPSIKKYYRAVLNGKKMVLEEISEKESTVRIYKVINKKVISEKIIQINLSDGKNLLSKEKIMVGDFVELDNKDNKIIKVIPLKKDVAVIGVMGKHMGKIGKIIEIVKEGENSIALVKTKEGESKININNIFVTD